MSWQGELKNDARELDRYSRELEAKLRFAEGRLADIAAALFYKDEVQDAFSLDTKLRITAAQGLAKLSKMPCRARPHSGRF